MAPSISPFYRHYFENKITHFSKHGKFDLVAKFGSLLIRVAYNRSTQFATMTICCPVGASEYAVLPTRTGTQSHDRHTRLRRR